MIKLNIFFTSCLLLLVSCEKGENIKNATILKECSSSYLASGMDTFYVLNSQLLTSYENGDEINVYIINKLPISANSPLENLCQGVEETTIQADFLAEIRYQY